MCKPNSSLSTEGRELPGGRCVRLVGGRIPSHLQLVPSEIPWADSDPVEGIPERVA